jgi:hypothetical protein
MNTIAKLLFAATLTLGTSAFAATPADLYGSAVTPAFTQRTIVIDATTRHVNVKHGEIVTFVNGANRVSWLFDGVQPSVALATIFPAAGTAASVQVYVEPAPKN